MPPDRRAAVMSWLVLVLCFGGCGPRTAAKPAVVVLAAASTADAVTEVADEFRPRTGIDVRVSAGPSNALARQVENGAPADLFLSASAEWAAAVADRTAESRPLLSNRLVLVVPKADPAAIREPADLAAPSVARVALAGHEVPAGKYAEAALAALGLLDRLQESGRIVRGHDVRVTLGFVERKEADAGLVYATDAAASDRVQVVFAFDPASHDPIVYPVVLLKDGPAGDAGRRFFAELGSPAAEAVFRRHGFLPAGADP